MIFLKDELSKLKLSIEKEKLKQTKIIELTLKLIHPVSKLLITLCFPSPNFNKGMTYQGSIILGEFVHLYNSMAKY